MGSAGRTRIELLGGFRVTVGTQAVDDAAWRLRKARALVKILALAPGHRMHQEQLLAHLWPDLPPHAATNNFHQTLHVARRALGAGETSNDSTASILLKEHVLILEAPEGLSVDTEAFEEAAAAAEGTDDIAAHEQALRLYGGELLPEDRYEEWAAERREALEQRYFATLRSLGRLYEAAGDLPRAADVLQRALAIQPTAEEVHAGLMRVYARVGRREDAIRQFHHLQDVLRRDFGVQPDAETAKLYQHIIDGHFSAGLPTLTLLEGFPGPPYRGVPLSLPLHATPIIGRDRELATLRDLLLSEDVKLVTLTGPPGVGKTRLALEVAQVLGELLESGVVFVDLAPIRDDGLFLPAIARKLRIPEITPSLLDQLSRALHDRQLLLVLDNFEHLAPAAEQVGDLIARCSKLKVLVTSRIPLRLRSEHEYSVLPLPVPEPRHSYLVDDLSRNPAVALFLSRARSVRADFVLEPDDRADCGRHLPAPGWAASRHRTGSGAHRCPLA